VTRARAQRPRREPRATARARFDQQLVGHATGRIPLLLDDDTKAHASSVHGA
jgi:hypothetical protein